MRRAVARHGQPRQVEIADLPQHAAEVDDALGDDMDDDPLALYPAADAEHRGGHHGTPLGLEAVGPQHGVGDTALVLQRHEHHALRATWPLADQNQTGHGDRSAVLHLLQVAAVCRAALRQFPAQEAQRMRPQR